MRSFIRRTSCLSLLAGIFATIAGAQTVSEASLSCQRPQETDTFGITGTVSHTLQSYAFQPYDLRYFGVLGANVQGSRFCIEACFLEAPLLLPAGATISRLSWMPVTPPPPPTSRSNSVAPPFTKVARRNSRPPPPPELQGVLFDRDPYRQHD